MMRYFLNSILFVFLFGAISVQAQDEFQGKAIYQTKTKLEIDFSQSGIPADRIKMIEERMKDRLEQTYELSFNKTASIYKQEEQLDNAGGRGGMRMMMFGGAGNGDYYKNIQTKKSATESEFSGKNFLIKGDLNNYEWKMEQETKMIGQNMCFKATTVVDMPVRDTEVQFGRRGPRNNDEEKEEDNDEEEEEEQGPRMEPTIVTAWYTMDIPVGHGPDDFWGLPGLILEVNYQNTNILCTKIVMNPKDKKEIKEPTKGKEVTQEEYDAIVREKMEEMRERMQNERQKGGRGNRIMIRG